MYTHICGLTSHLGLLEELAGSTDPSVSVQGAIGAHGTVHSLPSTSLLLSGDSAASLLGCSFESFVSCQIDLVLWIKPFPGVLWVKPNPAQRFVL